MNKPFAPSCAFLLGVPRSGTTMLSMLLDQHRDIHCPQEPWLLLALEALGQTPPDHPADSPLLAGLVAEFLGAGRAGHLKPAAEAIYDSVLAKAGKRLLVDKTPRYYLCLDLLAGFFPAAKGICLLRNPLDVAASYQTSWDVNLPRVIRERQDSPFLFDYVLGFRRLHEFQRRYGLMALHYETLVRDPVQEVRAVFAHLGVDGDEVPTEVSPQTADYAESGFADRKILGSRRVHADSIDSYKRVFSADEIAVLLGALGEELFVALGYGKVWQEAVAGFPPGVTVVEEHAALVAVAEECVAARREKCREAENDFSRRQLDDRLAYTTARNAELDEQLAQAAARNAALDEHLVQAAAHAAALSQENARLDEELARRAAENAALDQRVNDFINMGFRGRIRGLFGHGWRSLVRLRDRGLARLAGGRRRPPLPRITLVTPVFNGEAHIAETLESVLRQDYPDLEYIIVDGGSSDRTLEIIRAYRARDDFPQRIARVLSDPDEGMYDAIGKGFEQASGEIFCYLNADDLLRAGGLRSVGEYFAMHPRVQAIHHEDVVLVDGWEFPNARQPASVDTVDLLAGHILFQDGVFWRRACYERVGGVRRDLRLAGDFDLWLRMSAHCRFVRRPGHVSVFRIREGQLSAQMPRYHEEMRRSIDDFMAVMPWHRRTAWRLRRPLRRLYRRFRRRLERHGWRDRLFFAVDFAHLSPPKVDVPPLTAHAPKSPIDGRPAERLLFSTPDTRFGEQEINYIYLDTRHDVAIAHPPIAPERLDALYRRHYSNPPTEIVPPRGASPYRVFNGRRLWEKLLYRLPVERLRGLRPQRSNPWGDNTLNELVRVLTAAGVDAARPLRFLDTGCFEGNLLDVVREHTAWAACGMEPNAHAVAVARGKGHEVWQGHAERAVETVPEDRQFDVVFMGQSIEHVDDPLRVLRRLRLLLAPGGTLVMSTPNLDSREIDHFGPTWAHWHAPYHRHIFSRKGLTALVRQAGLAPVHFRSFSHPYWTTMSLVQNRLGLGGSVSHAVGFDPAIAQRGQRLHFWKLLLWNRLGKGDYCFIAARDGAND